ncbi:MAG: hypothetical protein PHU42_00980 [Patescibacteria group bacterium]|nr:hypothetical protein [Patescibacteria group bacterium]
MDRIEKFLRKIDKKNALKLGKILEDIRALNIDGYDLTKMEPQNTLYRIRSGKIRVVFRKENGIGVPIYIEFRGRVYKKF